ncbi:unnamed protein product [Schistosoma mattheei]|uniref:Uncharacterized protein n=1 Tax=Schistosoma mattheei TaxID=31246 RepID=A0AA85BCD7_9TREM|nr:unnamed protein product [Schistosoma mattheei]
MRHVRFLSQWQFYLDPEVNIPINFFLQEPFWGMLSCTSKILYRDRFKGFRTCSELSKKDQDFNNADSSNHVSKFAEKNNVNRQSERNIIETFPTIVSKHIVFSDSEENDKQPFAIALEEEKHLIDNTDVNCSSIKKPLQSRKYFTSVSYTLKHLLHSDSVISESDSSSDSNHELRTQNLYFQLLVLKRLKELFQMFSPSIVQKVIPV